MNISRLNKFAFFLIPAFSILTTLAYGTVHQPIIALFYVAISAMVIVWAADCLLVGTVRYSRSLMQIPLFLFGSYAFIQIIPFGTISDPSGGVAVPRTISVEPFSTQVTAIHILALCAFFGVSLVYLDSAARLRRLVTVFAVFGFAYAFFAILQSGLSPTKIYGIYKPAAAIPFGSFVNKHNFAAFIEMAICLPLGLLFVGAVKKDKRLLYGVAIAIMGTSVEGEGNAAEACLL